MSWLLRSMRGSVLGAVSLLSAVLVFLTMSYWWVQPIPVLASTTRPNSDTVDLLLRAGLGPEALAATGLGSSGVTAVVNAAEAWAAEHPGALTQADAAYAEAKNSSDSLDRKVRSGLASSGEITASATARSQLASATSARDSLIESAFAAGTAGLTTTQRAALQNVRLNASWELPVEFKVVTRTELNWVALRSALANEKFCTRRGEEMDASCVQLLGTARSDAAVASAKTNLDSNLSELRNAWNSAAE